MSLQKITSFTLLMGVVLIDWIGIGLVYPVFSGLMFSNEVTLLDPATSAAWRGWYLGLLIGLGPLAQFFSSPWLGSLSDFKGRKPIISAALLLAVCAYLLAATGIILKSLPILLFSRLAVGIAAGSTAAVSAAIADSSQGTKDKAKNFSLYNMACGVGFAAGPFLGGILSTSEIFGFKGFAMPFFFAATAAAINLVLVWLFLPETLHHRRREQKGWLAGLQNIAKAYRLTHLRSIFISGFLFCFGWSVYWELAPAAWIGHYGADTAEVGRLYAFGALIYALSCLILTRPILRYFSAPNAFLIGLVFGGITIALPFFHRDFYWMLVYIALQQYFLALLFPTASTIISDSADHTRQGEVMGVWTSVESLAYGVSPLAAGVLVGFDLSMPMLIGGVSLLLGAIVHVLYHPQGPLPKNLSRS